MEDEGLLVEEGGRLVEGGLLEVVEFVGTDFCLGSRSEGCSEECLASFFSLKECLCF